MRLDAIAGYTYAADQYCPDCIIEQMIVAREAAPAARDADVEEALDMIASANAITREDEYSYDSDEFPKVILADQAEGECGRCGRDLDG